MRDLECARNLLLLIQRVFQEWFRAKHGFQDWFFNCYSEPKILWPKAFISTRWCYSFSKQKTHTWSGTRNPTHNFQWGPNLCVLKWICRRHTLCKKTCWQRSIWVQRVKVVRVVMPSSLCSLHIPVSRLHAHLSAPSFSKMLLLPLSGMCVPGWHLGVKEWQRVSTVLDMHLPHPPTLSTRGSQHSPLQWRVSFPPWPTVIIPPCEFPQHHYFSLALGFSEVALEYSSTVSI